MRHSLSLIVALLSLTLLSSCLKDDCTSSTTYTQYDPVYTPLSEIRKDIQAEGPKDLVSPGKIYFYQNYLLINEINEGIHLINNENPEAPEPVAFLPIPGNVDMAMRGGRLYADSYIDLLCIDLTDPLQPKVISRQEGVFEHFQVDPVLGVHTGYEEVEKTMEIDCNSEYYGRDYFYAGNGSFFAAPSAEILVDFDANVLTNTQAQASGIGGSMARFTLYSDYLYAVTLTKLITFDIGSGCPSRVNEQEIGWGIETIIPYEDKLFVGSESGMFIFDASNPEMPVQLSVFEHARACDPVYVSGKHAYVTLRDGNECQGFINQLDLVDISNITNPELLRSFPMTNPHGLSIRGKDLYLCDGSAGLRVFDIENPEELDQHERAHIEGYHAYDAIALPWNDLLMVIGEDGFIQYDAQDVTQLKELSRISVK